MPLSVASEKERNDMTQYTGLYVQKLGSGIVSGVQVADPNGNQMNLTEQQYKERGVKPALSSLPSKKEWESNQSSVDTTR
jgi:hypothetical protein